MLEALISSKTRLKLLLKFFLNSETRAYLRGLASEFGESSNSIRVELNRLESAGMLSSVMEGNRKMYQVNKRHILFNDIQSILMKYIGFDRIVKKVISRLGDVERVLAVGKIAQGRDSNIIDLVFVGNLNKAFLVELIERVEKELKRKIRYVIYTSEEFNNLDINEFTSVPLLLWSRDRDAINKNEADND